MGKVGFAELAYWLVALRRPTPGELRVFEAVLVALADHGWREALDRDPHLRDGLNVLDGRIVHPAVAESLGLKAA